MMKHVVHMGYFRRGIDCVLIHVEATLGGHICQCVTFSCHLLLLTYLVLPQKTTF